MLIKPLIRHFFSAGNEQSLHSPFLFEFYNSVVKCGNVPVRAPEIEAWRGLLKSDKNVIEITDFGAGSRWNNSNKRKVSTIAKTSEKAQKWQLVLYNIVKNYFDNSTIIELGTSLGITTSYLASANPSNQVITFEGCPQISAVATRTFNKLGLTNISQVIGNIDSTLPDFLGLEKKVDFVFFDANHRYEPTMRYFELCLSKANEKSIFVFDDIYWSDEMCRAWEAIKKHEDVRQTLDFHQIGIVMFRETQPKQHFRLRT